MFHLCFPNKNHGVNETASDHVKNVIAILDLRLWGNSSSKLFQAKSRFLAYTIQGKLGISQQPHIFYLLLYLPLVAQRLFKFGNRKAVLPVLTLE